MLFASLLWGLVIARFGWWLKHSQSPQTAEVRQFCRQLSRMVYLILYLVIGAKQIFGAPGIELLPDDERGVPDCQVILAYGLIALVLIRLLAYLACLRLAPYRLPHSR
jgi:hypothetical protein